MNMSSKIKPWKLLSTKDISVSRWFPIEERVYQKANGQIVDDFSVTTVENVSLILPITPDHTIIMVRQFKPGAGEITTEFPGGRLKPGEDYLAGARTELLEETGMTAKKFLEMGETITFPTKGTERVMNYLALDVIKVTDQNLDENEEIEVNEYSFERVQQMISDGTVNTAPSITLWYLAMAKYQHLLH